MTRSEIISEVSKKTQVPKCSCESVFDAIIEEISDCVIGGDKIVLKNFMILETVDKPERKGRDPKTGEIVTFPATRAIKCRISKALKDAVSGK